MRVLTLLAVFVILPWPARAQTNRETQERAAKKACLVGDTAKGVEILADLFVDTNDPTYIFNQGRCFEQNRLYQDAIGRFREYLVKAKRASPEERADAEKHIVDCQTYLAEAAKAEGTPATPPVGDAVAPPQPPPFAGTPGVPSAPTPAPVADVPVVHNRRTPGTFWIAFGGGTGGVYHGRQAVDSRSKPAGANMVTPVAAGFAPASLFQVEPELGIQISQLFAVAVMLRYQYAPKDDNGYVPGVGEKAVLTSAVAGFLRGELSFLNLGNFRGYLSLGAGVGSSVLAVIKKDCDPTSCPLTHSDTLSGGAFALLGGLGATYHLTRNLAVFFDAKEIVTFRTVLALTEFNFGLAVAFDPW